MANWWEVSNQQPLAYQPGMQFQLPDWGTSDALPQTSQVMPVAASAAAAAGQATGPVDGGGLWGGGNLWGALGSTNEKGIRTDGWGGMALGLGQGLASAFMGMKQYQLAQDALKENKRQFSLNFENQRKLTNADLEDRQRARVASNPTAYQSVADYMKQNGV